MTLTERINYFESVFDELLSTNSLNEKREIVDCIPQELQEDFNYIIECLNGVHKFGYTYERYHGYMESLTFNTVKELLQYMQEPYQHDLSQWNILRHAMYTTKYEDFLEPIINRTLKLGIGKSLLEKVDTSPMLAKKYEPEKIKLIDKNGIFVTQKLDGNRCIAKYDGTRWHFLSRNGKEMHVDFDMSGLPTYYIYDGEVLSPYQTFQSANLLTGKNILSENTFNVTSGLINRHDKNKQLVYNIFDIIEPKKMYCERREVLDNISEGAELKNVRILPVLARGAHDFSENSIFGLLDAVTSEGAEGLMINFGSAGYENKRTSSLLKLKKMKTIDMQVIEAYRGTGKYEGCIGSLYCRCETEDGKIIHSYVGSGLSDFQRQRWYFMPDEIKGKIIEVGYFELSQSSDEKGTNNYSLRFPRLLKVRKDKDETSEF